MPRKPMMNKGKKVKPKPKNIMTAAKRAQPSG
jgi:hypothetical protein